MKARLWFSHGMVFIFDATEVAPGNDWTDQHASQGFARRPTSANVGTLIEDGLFTLEDGTPESLDTCERLVALSLRSDSGAISISTVDPESTVLWRGRPGWVRVTVGQMFGSEEREIRLLIAVEEAETEQRSRVREKGQWLAGPLVETAEAAEY